MKDNFNGELTINTIVNYKYDHLENDIKRLTHLYQFYNDKNVLFYTITIDNHDFSTSDFDENILNVKDNFCFNLDKTYNEIKIVLSLTRINEWGNGNIKLEMINDNYINIIYTEKIDVFKKFDENNKKTNALDSQLLGLKEQISDNNNLIGNNFTSILPLKSNYVIDNIWLFDLYKRDIEEFLIYENDITYNSKINSFIELNESYLYIHDSLKNFYFILRETYRYFDQNNTLVEEFSFNVLNKGAVFRNYQIYQNTHYYKIISNITNLKVRLYLQRIDIENDMEFKLQLSNKFQNNYISLKYFKYTS